MKVITTNENANNLLAFLCKEYDTYSAYCESAILFPMPKYFFHDYGKLYVRKMHNNQALCIPSVEFEEEVLGFGVFTAFIEHVKENPNCFKFIEVENIFNPRLINKLVELGFDKKPPKAGELDDSAPTYIFTLGKEQSTKQTQGES